MTPLSILSILTFVLLFDTGCGVDKTNLKVVTNDTTQIFRTLIDSAFYKQRLPEFNSLKTNNPFGDTIIFKFDTILIGHLPKSLKCKILTNQQICSLATEHLNDKTYFCNFLEINKLKKVGTTYEVCLENHCVQPLVKDTTKQAFEKVFYYDTKNCKCIYEKYCNGGINMTFTKKADTLQGKIENFFSY